MTPEELAERAVDNGECASQRMLDEVQRPAFVANIAAEIRAAVEQEREACALAASRFHVPDNKQPEPSICGACASAQQAAAAIRARGKK